MASSSSINPQSPGLKTHFKTPEGRYNLQCEKWHQTNLIQSSHGKIVSQVTLANLKEKPAVQAPATPTSTSGGSGYRLARLWGAGNGSKALGFVGGNGVNKLVSTSGRFGGNVASSGPISSLQTANSDGKGMYIIFNVGDTIFISDFNSQEKDPIKSIPFSNSNPMCHAFDAEAKDGHDLVFGLNSGDVYTVSLRHQLQDGSRKLIGAQHYNKEGAINSSQCTSIAWVPRGDGSFVVAHADGNLYVYDKAKEGTADSSFPVVRDHTQFSVAHAKSTKSNPVARWHVCQCSINSISFSADGAYLATVGRDGYLRVFDYTKEQLVFGGKSYYGALLCCAWSQDRKYILTGGEDDLVQVWSMDERKIVAWGEGHNSWVSGVAFDSFWSAPTEDDSVESVVYRFGSVGQDTQLLLWDLVIDELVVPLRRPAGGSPTFSSGSPSVQWDNTWPIGTLQPAPSMRDMPKLTPLVAHRSHVEPLSGLTFTSESVLTICREGNIKIWMRPGYAHEDADQTSTTEAIMGNSISKDKPQLSAVKPMVSSYRQTPIIG